MTEHDEDPVDLSPLDTDTELRALRIAARVGGRMAEARRAALEQSQVLDAVRRRLAGFAIPAALAAAATIAAAIVSGRANTARNLEPFAPAVLAGNPAMGWIAMDRRPDLAEVVAMLGGAR